MMFDIYLLYCFANSANNCYISKPGFIPILYSELYVLSMQNIETITNFTAPSMISGLIFPINLFTLPHTEYMRLSLYSYPFNIIL